MPDRHEEDVDRGPGDRLSSRHEVEPLAGKRMSWVFETHWSELARYARREMEGDWAGGEDVVAQTFDDLIQGKFDARSVEPARTLAFFRGVIRLKARNILRTAGRFTTLSEAQPIKERTHQSDPFLRRRIAEALLDLTHAEREVITLHYIDGYTIPEIALTRHVAQKTVEEQLRRARRKLHAKLAPYQMQSDR